MAEKGWNPQERAFELILKGCAGGSEAIDVPHHHL